MSKESFLSKAYAAARQAGLSPTAASLAAAQAAHETGYGKHAPRNNLFGIKAGKSWKGAVQSLKTKEEVNGKLVSVRANFRAYPSMAAAFKDYAKVVDKNWPAALTASTFAGALGALNTGKPGGYATDSKYEVGANRAKRSLDKFGIVSKFERPENFAYSGPKGKFSVGPSPPTSLTAAPVGKVGRAALAPAGMAQISPPGTMASPLSAAPVGKVTRASLAPPTNAPSIAQPGTFAPSLAPAPTSPVTRQALAPVSMPARPVTPTPAAAIAAINKPAFAPAIPSVVAPPTPVAPPAPVARVSAPVSRPSVPSAPRATAMDVYNGAAAQAFDNTGKNMVSRDALGNISVTNQYGVTTKTTPQGFSSVSYGPAAPSAPSSPSAISGPLSQPGISTPSKGFLGIEPAKTETGNIARGVVGSAVGSAIGSTLGPIGSLIGAALGSSIAKGKNPFDALTGNKQGMLSFNTPALGIINAPSPVGGLGFPNAPTARGALGGTQSNRSMDGMKGISPGAAAAIGKGLGGLY